LYINGEILLRQPSRGLYGLGKVQAGHSGPSVIWTPGCSGQFWANYSPVQPTEIIITVHNYYHNYILLGTVFPL